MPENIVRRRAKVKKRTSHHPDGMFSTRVKREDAQIDARKYRPEESRGQQAEILKNVAPSSPSGRF